MGIQRRIRLETGNLKGTRERVTRRCQWLPGRGPARPPGPAGPGRGRDSGSDSDSDSDSDSGGDVRDDLDLSESGMNFFLGLIVAFICLQYLGSAKNCSLRHHGSKTRRDPQALLPMSQMASTVD